MITADNLQSLLRHLGFEEKNHVFEKHFPQTGAFLKVDFVTKQLIYPEVLGMKVNERQTCNFEANENFVVFECVHRLLAKGYHPEHIELEPKWKVGRGASGGRADILVRNQAGKPLLLIECKTPGKEFKDAWKEMLRNGGQLFSYAQQIQETEFLCLYASDFEEKAQEITISQQIVSHKDNHDVLEQDKNLKSFAQAADINQRYEVWKNTYKLESTETGIFEESIQTYQIGKNKYTLEEDTKPLSSIDKKGLYHEFRTILRKHNVSRRENAFDVLVNLFLCKIIDETENKTDLKFRWKGIAYDNYYDLVDRLQGLYQIGMKKFLKEDILYVSNEEIDQAFWTTKSNRNATKKRIKEIFRELKFYKGLDFEFIKVHNNKGFDKNAKILIDIIKMWQSVRLTSQTQNQFLGDMFEFFLDNGIKQTEGQFFTPIPICKFIIAALPLEQKISQKSEPLTVIDYACGSGHFLTEYAVAAKPIIEKYKTTPPDQHYQHIFGIEKEDRLAKVATVSACMYGQKEINVIDTDALANHEALQKERFDVLVANPPFAVEDFLDVLVQNDEKEANTYELFDKDKIGTNNIQCFFLERAKHLLAQNGVAGIIVPTSILSNSDQMHIQTREILLKYFDFVSIVELGSGTFGKTGTNTVVLFLKRKAQKPEQAEHFWNRTLDFFENAQEEIDSNGGVYQDLAVLKNYCQHINMAFEHYQILLRSEVQRLAEWWQYEIGIAYKSAFEKSTELNNLLKKTEFKKLKPEEQQEKSTLLLLEYIRKVEQQKLFYFMLAQHNPQQVLLVKSPADGKEQKKFLGYEWTNAKGQEGIKYTGGETVYDIITPLFNPNLRDDASKVAHHIANNFENSTQNYTIPDNLKEWLTYAPLTQLLDFSRKDFNKALSLTLKKSISIDTQWELVKLENVMQISRGASPRPIDKYITEDKNGVNWIKIGDVAEGSKYITQTAEKITKAGAELSRFVNEGDFILSNSMSFGRPYIMKVSGCIHDGWLLLSNFSEKLNKDYLYEILSYRDTQEQFAASAAGGVVQNLNTERVRATKIPLPPLSVQEQIVSECEAIDRATEAAKNAVEKAKGEINRLLHFDNFAVKKLSKVAKKVTDNIEPQNENGEVIYIGLENIESQTGVLVGNIRTLFSNIKSTKTRFQENDVLYGKLRPNLNKVYLAKENGICSTDILVFRFENALIAKYYAHYFLSTDFNQAVIKTVSGQQLPRTSWTDMQEIQIPVPPLAIQEQLVSEIILLEGIISENERLIQQSGASKRLVLERYL
ncbi:MAG: N-6 DNA methylase [Chitinophagales bacterium]|nr:N-6 DNA methylase [Chitinophagales bacterium]